MKKIFLLLLVILFSSLWYLPSQAYAQISSQWPFQSIDTMKYSRDLAKQEVNDQSFDSVIDKQMQAIEATGATHVAIDTPYDEEFVPYLTRWVKSARKYHLHVWFRGNWSGWEGWFNYPKLTSNEHLQKTHDFILQHPDLFENGDVFTACPECENGGPGDPRDTKDVAGFRQFMISEYEMTGNAFSQIHKQVATNYLSMNGDVAKLIMDKPTTSKMDGVVTVDHYVKSPAELVHDLELLHEQSGGQIVLGEFGAPIPDIQGNMTNEEQAAWIQDVLARLAGVPYITGVNYWVSYGGSTAIWNPDNTSKPAVGVIQEFFTGNAAKIQVIDESGHKIAYAQLMFDGQTLEADEQGIVSLPYSQALHVFNIRATGYMDGIVTSPIQNNTKFILVKEKPTLLYQIEKVIYRFFPFLSF